MLRVCVRDEPAAVVLLYPGEKAGSSLTVFMLQIIILLEGPLETASYKSLNNFLFNTCRITIFMLLFI
jgi:hypothetical protein